MGTNAHVPQLGQTWVSCGTCIYIYILDFKLMDTPIGIYVIVRWAQFVHIIVTEGQS